jgi:hypothetical protein
MAGHDPAYRLDIAGVPADTAEGTAPAAEARRWIGVRFDCCSVYQRIYKSKDGLSYRGRCPRCLREVHVRVGPGGTDTRFFTAE